jgi:hypothetical protein
VSGRHAQIVSTGRYGKSGVVLERGAHASQLDDE